MSKYYVYALIDPINKVPFYIGKGCGDRMNVHLKEKFNPKSKKSIYMNNIRLLGFEPIADKIYDAIDEKDAYNTESQFIKIASYKKLPIVNRIGVDLQPPSRLGAKWTSESIKKRSDTVRRTGVQKGKIISQKQRDAISKALKGKPCSRKVYVDINELKEIYLVQNLNKSQVCSKLQIGMGSLNRILSEHNIIKVKSLSRENQDRFKVSKI